MSASPSPQAEPRLEPRKPSDPRLMSYTQRRLWYLDQLTPGTGVYNVPYVMRVRGPLNVDALHNAINKLIERHEVLRTVFLAPGGNPVPVLLQKFNAELKQYDLRNDPNREAAAERITNFESARPFNFARDLMFRAALIRLTEDEWVLIHVAHHIATEFGSTALIYKELTPLYEGFLNGNPVTLPAPKTQYADFCLWQHRFLQGQRLERLTRYWKQQLTGAPTLNLPTDKARPPVASLRGTRYPVSIAPELFVAIAKLSHASRTTPFRGTCAAFNVFLQAYTGQDDISVGSPIAARSSPGNYGAIGFFVNTLVLRSDLAGNPTLRELMSRINKVVQGAIDHADLTLDKLVEAVNPPREAGRMPLFQVNFRVLTAPVPALQLKGLEVTPPQFVDTYTAKFDLALELEAKTGQGGFFEYSTDLFERDTIAQMAVDFRSVLSALIANPDTPVQDVPAVREVSQRMRAKRGE